MMKAKTIKIEAFTITKVARIFGYKTTAVIYRLLNSGKLDNYIWTDISGRVYLMLEPPNLPTLEEKIRTSIQYRRKNIIKKRG